jgi:hypothetical protein
MLRSVRAPSESVRSVPLERNAEPAAQDTSSHCPQGSTAPVRVPLSGLPLLIHKLREGGLLWLRERLHDEWEMPRTRAGQVFLRIARAIGWYVAGGGRQERYRGSADVLHAFYDLGVAPVSFDFLWFLVGADLERRRRGLASVHAVIVPGLRGGLRRETAELESALDATARRARIFTILVPACTLLPSLSGVTVAGSRTQAEGLVKATGGSVFPARYEPALPLYPGPQEPLRAAREEGARIAVLRAPAADLRSVDAWLAANGCDGRVVSITLRSYGYVPDRNSNIAAWAAFARGLPGSRFSVVIVPDSEQCFTGVPAELDGLPIFSEAALALGLRMALYERAYLNLGVNNGPMGLCWLNERTRYLTFKILNDRVLQTTAEYMEFLGFATGRSLPFATEWQRWVWAEDDLPIITDAFEEMAARIDRAQPAASNSAA